MGTVVSIRQRLNRVCSDCEHALHGSAGVYCRVYSEDIWNESIANECDMWDPLPWAKSSERNEG